MYQFEGMYEHTESTEVRFIGFHSDSIRYDFGIIQTNYFYGNPLVINLQTGKAFLINAFDATNKEWIKDTFHTTNEEEIDALILFFKNYFPSYAFISET